MHRAAFFAPLVLLACAEPTPEPIDFAFCAEQHVEGSLVVCDKAFDTTPRIHLPPDDASTTYAAALQRTLVSRTGQDVVEFTDETYAFIEHVYAVTGGAYEPILRIAPEVLDGNLLGTWEGTLSKRIDASSSDATMRIPVRLDFHAFSDETHPIHRWNPYAADPVLTYAMMVLGRFENADAAVALADGSCAPSLAALGEASPRFGIAGDAVFMREVAMHVPGDTQLLFDGWMGAMDLASPGTLIRESPDPAASYSAYPHGAPNGQHLDDLHRVTTGGGACTP